VVGLGLFAALIGFLRAGLEVPPLGLGLWLTACLAFVATWVFERGGTARAAEPAPQLAARIDEPVHWRG
jgi:hypothetical protein